jgi:hypothetical protein
MMSLSLSSIIGSTVEYLPAYDIFASAASEDMIMQYHTITQEQFEEFQYYYIFDVLKDYIDTDCIIVFDELVNYPDFDGDSGELKAFYEFITENKVDYEWIGMNGTPTGMSGYYHENVALIIHSINQ